MKKKSGYKQKEHVRTINGKDVQINNGQKKSKLVKFPDSLFDNVSPKPETLNNADTELDSLLGNTQLSPNITTSKRVELAKYTNDIKVLWNLYDQTTQESIKNMILDNHYITGELLGYIAQNETKSNDIKQKAQRMYTAFSMKEVLTSRIPVAPDYESELMLIQEALDQNRFEDIEKWADIIVTDAKHFGRGNLEYNRIISFACTIMITANGNKNKDHIVTYIKAIRQVVAQWDSNYAA